MADFNALHNRVQRSVISYGIVCPVEVIIYYAGKPDARNIIFFCKNLRPCKRAVSAYYNKCVNAGSLHVVVGNLASLRGHESFGNSRIHSGSVSAGGEHSHSRNLCNNQLK